MRQLFFAVYEIAYGQTTLVALFVNEADAEEYGVEYIKGDFAIFEVIELEAEIFS